MAVVSGGGGLGIDRKGATGRGEPRIYKHGELFGNGRGEKSTEGVGRLLFNDFWTKCAVIRGAFLVSSLSRLVLPVAHVFLSAPSDRAVRAGFPSPLDRDWASAAAIFF